MDTLEADRRDLHLLKYNAYFYDASKTTRESNKDLVESNDGTRFPNDSPFRVSGLAQVHAARLEEAYFKALKRECQVDIATDHSNHLEICDFLKKLHQYSNYLEPKFIATTITKTFPMAHAYHGEFQKILHDIATNELINSDCDNEFVRGLIRGRIMLLLNILPTLILTTKEDIAAWKAHHLADMYELPPYIQPSKFDPTLGQTPVVSGVIQENPFESSEIFQLLKSFGGSDSTGNATASLAFSEPTDGNNAKSALLKQVAVADNISYKLSKVYLDDKLKGIVGSLSEVDKDFAAKKPQLRDEIKTLACQKLEEYYKSPYDDFDETIKAVADTVAQIYKIYKGDAFAELDKASEFYDKILTQIIIAFDEILYHKIRATGPMAIGATNSFSPCAILKLVLLNVRKEKTHKVQVPWGWLTVKGSGKLKVNDDRGHKVDIDVLYVPGSTKDSYVVHANRPFESRIKMLKDFPTIIPLELFKEKGYEKETAFPYCTTLTHNDKGTICLICKNNQTYVPLKQLLLLTRWIGVWSSLEKYLWDLLKDDVKEHQSDEGKSSDETKNHLKFVRKWY